MDGSAEIEQRVDTLVRQLVAQRASVRQIVAEVEALRQRYLTETNYAPFTVDRTIDLTLDRFFPVNDKILPMVPGWGIFRKDVHPAGIGFARQASVDDAQRKLEESSGFQSKNLKEILVLALNPRSKVYNSAFGRVVAEGLGLGNRQPTISETSVAGTRLKNATPQELHAFFVGLIDRHGSDEINQALWEALDDMHLTRLLSSLSINRPVNPATRKRQWVHNPNQFEHEDGPAGFSRFVFDETFARYVEQGSRGDIVPEETLQRLEARRQGRGGLLQGLPDDD